MQVTFEFTRADWLATLPPSYSRLFRTPSPRRSILVGVLVFAAVVILFASVGSLFSIIYAVKFGGFTFTPREIAQMVAMLIFMPIGGIAFGTVLPLAALYFFSGFPHRFTVTLLPDKLTRQGSKMDVQVPWQDVVAISGHPKQIFLYFKSPQLVVPSGRSILHAVRVPFIIIPKHAFADDAAAAAFRKEAEQLWTNAQMGLTGGETPEGVWPPAPRRGN